MDAVGVGLGEARDAEGSPAFLGVGFPYVAALPREFYRSGILDFVEVTPETLCDELPDGGAPRLRLLPDRLAWARATCEGLPIVVHGVELSIGSAHGLNGAYLEMLDAFQAAWPFVWHSEHLGFQTAPTRRGVSAEIGVPLPLPPTLEAARLVARRAEAIRLRFAVPFLLENPAHYLADLPSDPEIGDEFGLMRRILDLSGCGQLLDLHNLYCNAVNFGFDAFDALERIGLEQVLEIHVAGGHWRDGFRMDAHDGRVPGQVWDLLERALAKCPAVRGVVFEVLDEYAPSFGSSAIEGELARARDLVVRAARAKAA